MSYLLLPRGKHKGFIIITYIYYFILTVGLTDVLIQDLRSFSNPSRKGLFAHPGLKRY